MSEKRTEMSALEIELLTLRGLLSQVFETRAPDFMSKEWVDAALQAITNYDPTRPASSAKPESTGE